jgi:hypothetical protein
MRQRVPPRWDSPTRPHHAPRLLVEDDDPALALSDFSRFHRAGFDVAWCSGPAGAPDACGILCNEGCPLVRAADVVLHGLNSDTGIASAIRTANPEAGLVRIVRARVGTDHSDPDADVLIGSDCVLSGSDGVETQVRALRHALSRRCPSNPASTEVGPREG